MTVRKVLEIEIDGDRCLRSCKYLDESHDDNDGGDFSCSLFGGKYINDGYDSAGNRVFYRCDECFFMFRDEAAAQKNI